jgi:hypothetical protein
MTGPWIQQRYRLDPRRGHGNRTPNRMEVELILAVR